MKPVIGIVPRSDFDKELNRSFTYFFEKDRRCFLDFDAVPYFITPIDNVDYYETSFNCYPLKNIEYINTILDNIDALYIPGGLKYSKFEFYILDEAIKRDMPILGVCLGAQMLSNYKKDYSLDTINTSINHLDRDKDYVHEVSISKDSILYNILLKDKITVNSLHRKCMSSNPLFNSVSYAPDGVLEAIEMKNKSFVLGLQWHPEMMYSYDNENKKIMEFFIKKALEYKINKKELIYE